MYLTNTLILYFTCYYSEMDAQLSTGEHRYSLHTEQLFTADPATMTESAVKGSTGGVLTKYEARAQLNLPHITGGDEIMASLKDSPSRHLNKVTNNRTRSDPENEYR